jgi:hypothetical protein
LLRPMPAIPAPAAAIRPANAKFEWRFRFIEDALAAKGMAPGAPALAEMNYKPFWADPDRDCDTLNELAKKLHKKIKNHTFHRMRALFLQHMVNRPETAPLHRLAVRW